MRNRMTVLASVFGIVLAVSAAAADVKAELARVLGDSRSFAPAIVSGLRKGMTPEQVRRVLPGLPASVKSGPGYVRGAVPMEDPVLEEIGASFHDGKLTTVVLVFRRDVDRDAFKAASLAAIESKWSVKVPAAERGEDLVTLMPGGNGVQRSFLVDHWELEVELP